MILLLGGTTEAGEISQKLVETGFDVLLSTATNLPFRHGRYPGVHLRTGPLDKQGIVDVLKKRNIACLVDATHPYAAEISFNAHGACKQTGIRYVAYNRPGILQNCREVSWAKDHFAAADFAGSSGQPVLLTIGIRNLAPYVKMARERQIQVVARVLDHPASVAACRQAGLAEEAMVCANGPFSVEENIALLRRYGIKVLVTKDSGEAGGVGAKLVAARETGCRLIAVRRPPRPEPGVSSVADIITAVKNRVF